MFLEHIRPYRPVDDTERAVVLAQCAVVDNGIGALFLGTAFGRRWDATSGGLVRGGGTAMYALVSSHNGPVRCVQTVCGISPSRSGKSSARNAAELLARSDGGPALDDGHCAPFGQPWFLSLSWREDGALFGPSDGMGAFVLAFDGTLSLSVAHIPEHVHRNDLQAKRAFGIGRSLVCPVSLGCSGRAVDPEWDHGHRPPGIWSLLDRRPIEYRFPRTAEGIRAC